MKAKDLDGRFHVSPGEEITRDRNYPTTSSRMSGRTHLRRLDTFSGGVGQPRTTKPHPNSGQDRRSVRLFCCPCGQVLCHLPMGVCPFQSRGSRSEELQRGCPTSAKYTASAQRYAGARPPGPSELETGFRSTVTLISTLHNTF